MRTCKVLVPSQKAKEHWRNGRNNTDYDWVPAHSSTAATPTTGAAVASQGLFIDKSPTEAAIVLAHSLTFPGVPLKHKQLRA
eukprot:265245-Amphidinium_carterae.1